MTMEEKIRRAIAYIREMVIAANCGVVLDTADILTKT